ncbi:MAG TPA: DUF6036 family nucleotidyltransferase [Candidatus Eisenbacteria bacterium]|nr:DUF6036 family nucleotidyltransferase [Candidatus Eisenbacteria bacterium]
MTARSVVDIVRALNATSERYLIAGGLAVVAHGYVRLTLDVDLMLDLASPGLSKVVQALEDLGYEPKIVPVRLTALLDPVQRASWVRDKGAVVLNLRSTEHVQTGIDVFLDPPLDFDPCWSRMVKIEVEPGMRAPFVSREDLLEMKRKAGRPRDLEDIRALEDLGPQEPR